MDISNASSLYKSLRCYVLLLHDMLYSCSSEVKFYFIDHCFENAFIRLVTSISKFTMARVYPLICNKTFRMYVNLQNTIVGGFTHDHKEFLILNHI